MDAYQCLRTPSVIYPSPKKTVYLNPLYRDAVDIVAFT